MRVSVGVWSSTSMAWMMRGGQVLVAHLPAVVDLPRYADPGAAEATVANAAPTLAVLPAGSTSRAGV